MKQLIALLCLLIISASAYPQKKKSIADTRLNGVDAELQKVLDTWKAPGFAVAVVEKNKIIYAKGFGYSDYENKVPVTPNTLFAIGSCSKAFTSAVLGMLSNEKKLDFDDSPRKYIPELKFYNSEMDNSITIRDMMTHRTGLPRHDFSWYLFPSNSKDSLIQRIAFQEPFTGLRKKWYYNNFMFLAQGVVAERITGKTWEQNVAEKIFTPLGMTRSNFSIPELQASKDVAYGYELKDETTIKKMDYYHIAGMSPAGSINSSVNEMSNWVMTWIYGGKFKGKELLPAAYVNEAMSSQMVIGAALPDKDHTDIHFSNYGYGWFMASYKGHYRVEHGGNIDGFSASTSFFPGDSIGIVVLVNQNGSGVPGVVRNILADRLLKAEATDWNTELKAKRDKAIKEQLEAAKQKVSSQVKGTRPSHSLVEYAGRYTHPGYGSFTIVLDRDSLFAKFKLEKLWLKHHHYDVFEFLEVTKEGIDTTNTNKQLISFTANESGEISKGAVKMEAVLPPIEFKREASKIDVSKADLESYPGEYVLGGLTSKVYLKGSTLYLFVPGQPEYELIPTGENKFSIKILEGFKLEFIKSGKDVIELMFIQPNGTFKAKRK
jgi:CubicO group peptidase (beta-lactamase class C family)